MKSRNLFAAALAMLCVAPLDAFAAPSKIDAVDIEVVDANGKSIGPATNAGGILFDRSVFAAINLNGANGDGLQSTYSFTLASGG